ncbi:hypothetical protein BH09ACT6_BH09ACT6_11910 [soil metagenome]
MIVLECRAVTRRFDEQNFPLKSVEFTAHEGEFIAITGPSGAGKSTLLNILGLLDRASSGAYLVEGVDVTSLSDSDRDDCRGRQFGFVFQASYLISGRTAAQNVSAALQYSPIPRDERERAIVSALTDVGLAHKLDSNVDRLSGGERQRVAIARALVHRPRVLFLDEPTGSLDEQNTEVIVGLLEVLRDDGMTVIVVTHDDRVSRRADRHLRLAGGVIDSTSVPLDAPVPPVPAFAPGSAQVPEPTPDEAEAEPVAVADADADRVVPPRSSPAARLPRPHKRTSVRVTEVISDALFSIRARPFKALMATLIVALGTGGFVISSGLSSTASHQVDSAIQTAAGSTVRAKYADAQDTTGSFDAVERDLGRISAIDGVVGAGIRWDLTDLVGPVRRTSDPLQPGFGNSVRFVAVQGALLDATGLQIMPTSAAAVFTGPAAVRENVVILGARAATTLGIGSPGAGQTIWVGPTSFSVVGIARASVFQSETSSQTESFDDCVFVSRASAAKVSRILPAGEFVVTTAPGMAGEIAGALPLTLEPAHPEFVHVETAAQLKHLRTTVNEQLQQLIGVTAGVLILLAILVTTAITMTGVNARRSEIALRRATGARRSEIASLFVTENAIVGMLGGFLGVAIGEIVIVAGAQLLQWSPVIDSGVLIIGPIIGVGVASAAAVVPSLRSASVQPSIELHST